MMYIYRHISASVLNSGEKKRIRLVFIYFFLLDFQSIHTHTGSFPSSLSKVCRIISSAETGIPTPT